MTEYLSSYEDSETINERMAEEKKLAVVVKVSAAVKRCRTDPSSFVEELFRLKLFLQTPPIVRLDFPATVLRLEHEGLVMQANEKEFWPLLTTEALTAATFENHEEQATLFVMEAMAGLQQVDSYALACQSLKDFAAALGNASPPVNIAASIADQMECVDFLVMPAAC